MANGFQFQQERQVCRQGSLATGCLWLGVMFFLLTLVSDLRAQTVARFYARPSLVNEGDAVSFYYVEATNSLAKTNIAAWQWDFDGKGRVEARAAASEWWQARRRETLIEYPPLDADALGEELLVVVPQVFHVSAPVAGLQNSDATHDSDTSRLREPTRGAFVNDNQVRLQRSRQQHGGKFASAERMLLPERSHCRRVHFGMRFNPVGRLHHSGGRASGALHHDFLMNLGGEVNAPKQFAQQVELPDAGQGDEGRGIGNDDHSLSCCAVSRSSARSAAV